MAGTETELFEVFFRDADLNQDGRISSQEAVAFFQGANLPEQVLAQVWMYADQNQTGFLGRPEFFNALRLVTVAQSGRELTPDMVRSALYGPAAPKIPPPKIEAGQMGAYFNLADLNQDGRISRQEAVVFFQGANLPEQVINEVWTYADQNKTGFLSRSEFFNALRLVTVAQNGRELTPDMVRSALYGPAAPKIPPPMIEAGQMGAYFDRADLNQDGRISRQEAVVFFQGANLPEQVINEVWTYADQNKTGFLSRSGFFNALRLVTVAQSGCELTPDVVRSALYGPAALRIPPPKIAAEPAPAQMGAAMTPTRGQVGAPQMNPAATPTPQGSGMMPTSSQVSMPQVNPGAALRYMELNILERIVNESEEPGPLDFALLYGITEKFSEEKKIGCGGCGIVYKGILQNGVVAVKRLHSSRTIKDKMFHREVISLISVKHPNIVRFLGYCSFTEEHAVSFGETIIMADIRERLLCFEYIRNGSLDQHLSDELRGLEWQTRYQIIIGICRGLHYLHKDKEIIHMDLKPGNILLDDLMVPKITDFGLSRPESYSLATTTRLISQGYTAPEYISEGKATTKSDIYSLGVIIIELVTGSRMKPNITKVIRRWNHRWIKSTKQSSLAYQQVNKCLQLALRCIQVVPTDGPDISDIIRELEEIDTTDGQTQIQISPCWLEDILGIEPLEIRIPFEDLKIPHSIELTNDTDDYIAFATKAKLERFCTEPNRGVVPPRSRCSVTLATEARFNAQPNVHYTEVITVLSTRVDGASFVDAMDVTSGEIFIDKEGKVVDQVNVIVVFGTPQLRDE